MNKGRIMSRGRIQIPADMRRELGLSDGDPVRLEIVEGELRVRSFKSMLERARTLVREAIPNGISLSEELIEDRRADR